MKYPFYAESKPVVGREAEKLVRAIESGGYIANQAAIVTAKRIAECRKRRKIDHATER
jgi:hypothetical protein